MKKILFTAALFSSFACFAQSKINYSYRFKIKPKIYCDTVNELGFNVNIGSDSLNADFATFTTKENMRERGIKNFPKGVLQMVNLTGTVNIDSLNVVLAPLGLEVESQITN